MEDHIFLGVEHEEVADDGEEDDDGLQGGEETCEEEAIDNRDGVVARLKRNVFLNEVQLVLVQSQLH